VRSASKEVIERGGVVRGFENWGVMQLPTRTRRHQEWFTKGHFWLMHFDSNPTMISQLRQKFKKDPRVIRGNFVKLGEKLGEIIDRRDTTIISNTLPSGPVRPKDIIF